MDGVRRAGTLSALRTEAGVTGTVCSVRLAGVSGLVCNSGPRSDLGTRDLAEHVTHLQVLPAQLVK